MRVGYVATENTKLVAFVFTKFLAKELFGIHRAFCCMDLCLFVYFQRYYAFEDAFAREVLGKKLSKGTKKDLDDISAKTGITLKSCRRQVRE